VNPEFQRYLWLELSFHRMVAVPVILLAVFGLAYLLSDSDALWGMASTSYWMVIVLGVLWGARSASEAVVSEVQEGTWDQQRLSSLSPWSMTWGKLAGSTVFTWYAVAPCLLVLAIGAATRVALVDAVGHALLLAAIVFFAQAVGLLASLHLAARGTAVTRRAAMSLHLVGLAAAAPMLFVSMAGFFDGFAGSVDWFAWEVSTRSFACASVGAFTFWAVLGCHRLMRAELQLPNAPWVWIGFVSFCMVYGAGLAWRADGMPGTAPGAGETALAAALIAAHLVALGLGYGMLFVEGKDPVVLRRLLREVRDSTRAAHRPGERRCSRQWHGAVCIHPGVLRARCGPGRVAQPGPAPAPGRRGRAVLSDPALRPGAGDHRHRLRRRSLRLAGPRRAGQCAARGAARGVAGCGAVACRACAVAKCVGPRVDVNG
jgi:hypothetical protein